MGCCGCAGGVAEAVIPLVAPIPDARPDWKLDPELARGAADAGETAPAEGAAEAGTVPEPSCDGKPDANDGEPDPKLGIRPPPPPEPPPEPSGDAGKGGVMPGPFGLGPHLPPCVSGLGSGPVKAHLSCWSPPLPSAAAPSKPASPSSDHLAELPSAGWDDPDHLSCFCFPPGGLGFGPSDGAGPRGSGASKFTALIWPSALAACSSTMVSASPAAAAKIDCAAT
uniref:Uncharacterized protein n=1 Tax=Mycobacterium kansasii TaxID=1768 RepID=A0A653F578_MYCKA|nr:hypothetical protein BIN_B_04754 [Mycobacterium kansasii]